MTYVIPPQFSVANKVFLITGGTSGIGFVAARGFARAGGRVAICGRNPERLAAALSQLENEGLDVMGILADIRVYDQVEAMVRRVVDRFGRIDVLINNAGGTFRAPAEDITPGGWNAVVATNLTGPFYCCRAVFPIMRTQGEGKIINIGSIAAFSANVGGVHYGAAKRGLESMTETLAAEWGRYNILVNCVAPGPILTDASSWSNPEVRAQRAATVPLGRVGTPEDVFWAAYYLASDACRFVTGAVLRVDGGPRLGYLPLPAREVSNEERG